MSDTKFKPGVSGNPAGRPKGISDRRSRHRELLESRAPELIQKAVDLALEGDTQCLKMCLERIIPPCRGEPVQQVMDNQPESSVDQANELVACAMKGAIPPHIAKAMLSLLKDLGDFKEAESRRADSFDVTPVGTVVIQTRPAVDEVIVTRGKPNSERDPAGDE